MTDEIPIVLPPDENHSDPPSWRHWTLWLRPIVALPLMLFVLLLLSPFLVRGWHLAQVPDIADPFDVEAFLSETVEDKDNAFVDYHAAQSLFVSDTSLTADERQELEAGWGKTSPPVRAWVDANLPALNRWRTGTEKNGASDGDLRNDPWCSLPEFRIACDFSQLALLQGEREQSEGHMVEAWKWFRAAIRHSRHVVQRRNCYGRTLGCTLYHSTANRIAAWANDSRTSSVELQTAAINLQDDFRLTRPFSETLKVDYCDLPKYARHCEGLLQTGILGLGTPTWRQSRWYRFCLGQPEVSTRFHKLAIENWLCASELPRWSQSRIGAIDDSVLDLTAPGSSASGTDLLRMRPFCETGVMRYAETRDHIDCELARHEALRLTLACQLWFRRHGVFPAKLDNLVPDMLPELPVDPFGKAGEMFRYLHDGEAVVVYSLGPDVRDDHGSVELTPGTGYFDLGNRLEPSRIREPTSEQKPVDEP